MRATVRANAVACLGVCHRKVQNLWSFAANLAERSFHVFLTHTAAGQVLRWFIRVLRIFPGHVAIISDVLRPWRHFPLFYPFGGLQDGPQPAVAPRIGPFSALPAALWRFQGQA
jgi:hypothetical protein